MTEVIIKITGTTEFILNYLLTFDDVVVVETNRRIKESPTIKVHIVPPAGHKEEYVNRIIEGKPIADKVVIPRPKVIAVEAPIEITTPMREFIREGGVLIEYKITHDGHSYITVEKV